MTTDAGAFFAIFKLDAETIAQMFLSEIASVHPERKLQLVFAIHEIIALTIGKGDEFIKAFGGFIRLYIDQITLTNEVQIITGFMQVLSSWEKNNFYALTFLKKMKDLLAKKLESLKSDNKAKTKPTSKVGAKEFQLVLENETCKSVFDLRANEHELAKALTEYKQLFDGQHGEDPAQARALKKQQSDAVASLRRTADGYTALITSLGVLMKSIPAQSTGMFEELKAYADGDGPEHQVLEGYWKTLAQIREEEARRAKQVEDLEDK